MAQYDRAIADFTRAIRLEPNDADAYYGRGTALGEKGEHDNAIADFTQAIRLKPENGDAYYRRGVAFESKREHDKAIADFEGADQSRRMLIRKLRRGFIREQLPERKGD